MSGDNERIWGVYHVQTDTGPGTTLVGKYVADNLDLTHVVADDFTRQ